MLSNKKILVKKSWNQKFIIMSHPTYYELIIGKLETKVHNLITNGNSSQTLDELELKVIKILFKNKYF
jgi:hypothetical protein